MGYFNFFSNKNKRLSHHGIKGQKWGVRRFQNKDGSRTEAGKKQDRYNKTVRNAKSSGKARDKDLEDYNVGLTTFSRDNGEQWVSGLSNAHDFDWQERFNGESAANPDLLRETDDWYQQNVPNRGITSFIAKRINPGFGSSGTTQNCAKCSSALELVLHGYTASAGRQSFPSTSDAPELWWKGAQAVEYDDDSCESSLRGYGPGTSGTISIRYPGSDNGHAMHWTNDTTGRFTIEDGQNGRIFSSLSEMTSTYGADTSAGYRTYRLDNCEPNWDAMGQDSVVRISSAKDERIGEGNRGLRNARNEDSSKVYNRFEGRYVDRW